MIDKETIIVPGMIVRHDDGLKYLVEDVRISTIGYEKDHVLGGFVINYTQLDQGSYDPGSKWSKDEPGFREHFTPVADAN